LEALSRFGSAASALLPESPARSYHPHEYSETPEEGYTLNKSLSHERLAPHEPASGTIAVDHIPHE
jgi:hypothetical protein